MEFLIVLIVIQGGAKFSGGLAPRWGSVNLVHHIGDLLNLTVATVGGFQALLVGVQVLYCMAQQNRLVLDQLLAAQFDIFSLRCVALVFQILVITWLL